MTRTVSSQPFRLLSARGCFRYRYVLGWLVFGLVLGCSQGVDSAKYDEHLVLTDFRLIDGNGGSPIPNSTLVVKDERIVAVGPSSTVEIPPHSQTYDLNGATVLPGFINAHIHRGFYESNLRAWARAGVTTVRDLAGPTNFNWRDQVAEDPYCALLVTAGPIVSVPNGYPQNPWGSPEILPVTTLADAEDKVTQLLESGADIVKIAIESGGSWDRTIPTLSLEQAQTIIATAHAHGTVVSAHVLMAEDLARAIDAGVDDIAHMIWDDLPDDLVDAMMNECITWVPTLELWHHVDPSLREVAITNLSKFVQAGGPVALGTDYAGYSGTFQMGMPLDEMGWMIEAGMTPMQVIVAGTRNAAATCNRLDDLGTLSPGKLADVLVVGGDPLTDIDNLANVLMVLHRGTIIRNELP